MGRTRRLFGRRRRSSVPRQLLRCCDRFLDASLPDASLPDHQPSSLCQPPPWPPEPDAGITATQIAQLFLRRCRVSVLQSHITSAISSSVPALLQAKKPRHTAAVNRPTLSAVSLHSCMTTRGRRRRSASPLAGHRANRCHAVRRVVIVIYV